MSEKNTENAKDNAQVFKQREQEHEPDMFDVNRYLKNISDKLYKLGFEPRNLPSIVRQTTFCLAGQTGTTFRSNKNPFVCGVKGDTVAVLLKVSSRV